MNLLFTTGVDMSPGADEKKLFNHKFAKSRQGCCMLDKVSLVLMWKLLIARPQVVAFMEVIHLLRTCKTFEMGTVEDGEQNQQTRTMDKRKVDGLSKEDKWGRCDAGAMSTIFWHMRACCVDKVFFFDHSERSCVRLIHQVMRDTQSLQREYKKCTGGGNGKPIEEKVCKDVEDGLMALGKKGRAGIAVDLHVGCAVTHLLVLVVFLFISCVSYLFLFHVLMPVVLSLSLSLSLSFCS